MSGTHTLILPVLFLVCGIVIFLLGLTLLRVGRMSAPTRAAAGGGGAAPPPPPPPPPSCFFLPVSGRS
jgi:hypothetical protein